MTGEQQQVHVVAAVLTDLRGRILLTRRTENRDFAGLWECPGGKVEPGEAPLAALARELHEELGIDIALPPDGAVAPLIRVPCLGRSKRLLLDVHLVERFSGRPRGLEGQAITWVAPDKLWRYGMPPADRPVVAALTRPALQLVTPEPAAGQHDAWLDHLALAATTPPASVWERIASATLSPGAHAALPCHPWERTLSATSPPLIQLRLKSLPAEQRTALTREAVQRLGPAARSRLLINGDPVLAAELGAGLHLASAQLMALRARPDGMALVAASCHTLEELRHAEALGLDHAVLGPVACTQSHPGARALGWAAFAALREQVSLPVYAIGGLSPPDLATARAHGAQGIAAIRGLWSTPR